MHFVSGKQLSYYVCLKSEWFHLLSNLFRCSSIRELRSLSFKANKTCRCNYGENLLGTNLSTLHP